MHGTINIKSSLRYCKFRKNLASGNYNLPKSINNFFYPSFPTLLSDMDKIKYWTLFSISEFRKILPGRPCFSDDRKWKYIWARNVTKVTYFESKERLGYYLYFIVQHTHTHHFQSWFDISRVKSESLNATAHILWLNTFTASSTLRLLMATFPAHHKFWGLPPRTLI
jgi:hypothetical protein